MSVYDMRPEDYGPGIEWNRWDHLLVMVEEHEAQVAAEREARRCKNCGWLGDEPDTP